VPAGGAIIVPMNGAYAERVLLLARSAGRVAHAWPVPDTRGVTAEWFVANENYVPLEGFPYDTIAADLVADPIIRLQHKYYIFLAPIMGVGVPTLICGLLWGDWFGGYFIAGIARLVMAGDQRGVVPRDDAGMRLRQQLARRLLQVLTVRPTSKHQSSYGKNFRHRSRYN
jgi:hypothetical protein